MSTPHDPHDDPQLRARLQAAYAVSPPAHLTARVEERARPGVSPAPAGPLRHPLGEIIAPAAGIGLLLAFLGGISPLIRLLVTGGHAGAAAGPPIARLGLPGLGPALAALLVPLLLGWLFELSRGAPLLRRFLR